MLHMKPMYIGLIVLAVVVVSVITWVIIHMDQVRCPVAGTSETGRYDESYDFPCPKGGSLKSTCGWNSEWINENKDCKI
jgi:hypothetical protein